MAKLEKLFPLGSVVQLKNGAVPLMIIARCVEKQHAIYDYASCLQTEGVVGEMLFFFNNEEIDKVIFEGYYDEVLEELYALRYPEWKERRRGF